MPSSGHVAFYPAFAQIVERGVERSIWDENAVGRIAARPHPCPCNSLEEGGAKHGVEDKRLVALPSQPQLVLLGLGTHQVWKPILAGVFNILQIDKIFLNRFKQGCGIS